MPLILVDINLMEHALSNLITNAIMYGKENSDIYIKVNTTKSFLKIAIEDQGPGIPDSEKIKFSKNSVVFQAVQQEGLA